MLVSNSSNEVLIRVFFLVGTFFATTTHCSNFVYASSLSVIVFVHSVFVLEFLYPVLLIRKFGYDLLFPMGYHVIFMGLF